MPVNNSSRSVLVVDDDDDMRFAICNILKKCDCLVSEAITVEAALEDLSNHRYNIVFCDLRFHGSIGGEALLEYTTQYAPDIDVVLISCDMNDGRKKELISLGAALCIQKPFFKDACLQVLSELDHRHRKSA